MTASTEAAATANRMLDHVQAFEVEAALELFREDGILELPNRPGGHPTSLQGRQLAAFLHALPTLFRSLPLTGRRTLVADVPGVVVVEYRSDGVAHTGRPYRNRYVSIFEVDDGGRVALWREYFDPLVVIDAMRPADSP